MKPPSGGFQEARSTPAPGDGPNGPHVDGSSSHRSRKYNRKSPTSLSFGDEPFRNRNSQGNHTGHGHGSHLNKRGPEQEPVVECGEHSMMLTVRGGRASLRVNGANTSGLPLSQLPPECGYSVTTSSKNLRFEVPYSACHVQQEDGRYVLPLIWRGVQVEMSCPISKIRTQQSPILGLGVQDLKSSVCCTSHGLTFTLPGQVATSELKIKVRGEWLPLLPLAWQCGYTLNRQQGEMLVSASYTACGVLIKDGQYTLVIRVGEEAVTLVCPADLSDEAAADQASNPSSETLAAEAQPFSTLTSSASPRPPTAKRPPALTRFSVERSAAIRPRPHPHYQHHHQHQRPFSDSYWARTRLLPHPRPTMGPAGSEPGLKLSTASPPIPSQTSDPEAHIMQTSTSVLHSFLPVRPRSASLQSRYTDHHPHYHFYHHPKIPVPFPDPAEEPGTGKQTVPNKRAAWVDPPAHISRTVTSSYPNVPPALPKMDRFVPQPFPQLNQSRRTALHLPSRPLGKQIKESPPADASYESLPEGHIRWLPWQPHHLAGQIPSLPPSSDHPHAPVPSPDALPPHFPYIYHPYYSHHYYHGANPYRTPQRDVLLPPSTTSSQTPVPTVTVAPHRPSVSPRSHYKSKITSRVSPFHLPDEPPTTESPFPSDIPPDHPLYPYYYYYHHHHPQYYQSRPTPAQDQDRGRRPTQVKHSNPSLDLDQLVARPSDPHLKGMLDSQPSLLMSQQQPANQHPKFLGDEIAGRAVFRSVSDMQTPCGRDSVCSGPVESYTVKGCTVGRHFVFAVPGTLVESTLTSPLSLKSRNESCTPRRLMHADSTLSDLYTVPLHGCGVQKYAVGQTVVHLLEVRGFQAPPTEAGIPHQEDPVRLMVECTGSPGVPGKVTLRKMSTAPPPPVQTPGAMAVQLRIATDGQYNGFLPEPHLPLARLLGRPLYLELVLLNAPDPGSVLLVNYCVAYTHAPHPSWMFIYDGCPRDGAFPAPSLSATQRLTITAFQALSKQRPTPLQTGRTTDQPEVYFLCSTEVCSPKDVDCAMSCISGRPNAGSLS